ncbi:MAG: FmdB family zinc ribbon protein [Candidatus Marinamargulisbacteria bacterium]
MPTYTYRCESCCTVTEAVQSMQDPPLTHCLKCNGPSHRIISGDISIQFKGSGFYCNDK